MSKEIKIAGSISFGGKRLNVYGDLDAPLFKAKDISHAIGYSSGNEWRMLEICVEKSVKGFFARFQRGYGKTFHQLCNRERSVQHPCSEPYGDCKILETCSS